MNWSEVSVKSDRPGRDVRGLSVQGVRVALNLWLGPVACALLDVVIAGLGISA